MISFDGIQLGSFMFPWVLLILFSGILFISILINVLGYHYKWTDTQVKTSKDSVWTSIIIGAVAARVIFVMFYWEIYIENPLDILKIQDKGFSLWSGLFFGGLSYIILNRSLRTKMKIILVGVFLFWVAIGVMIKTQYKVESYYPDLSFQILPTDHSENKNEGYFTDFLGQPTVVNLWASWCPPCHREMPILFQAQKAHPNIHFVMLNQGEDITTVQNYLQNHSFNFKNVRLDVNGEMPKQSNSFGLPTTLFYDEKGKLVDRHMGELSAAKLQEYLIKMTAE